MLVIHDRFTALALIEAAAVFCLAQAVLLACGIAMAKLYKPEHLPIARTFILWVVLWDFLGAMRTAEAFDTASPHHGAVYMPTLWFSTALFIAAIAPLPGYFAYRKLPREAPSPPAPTGRPEP